MIKRKDILDKLHSSKSVDDLLDTYIPEDEEELQKDERPIKLISDRTVKQQNTMKDLHRYNQRKSYAQISVQEDIRKLFFQEERDSVSLGSYVLLHRGLRGQITKVYPDGNTYDMIVQPTGDIITISGSEILRTLQYA
jgi:hypothetical protein